MFDVMKKELQQKMELSLTALQKNLAKVRTGRANPALLDTVRADVYGSPTPLNQLANVSVEDNRTLSISVWDKANVPAVEKAILKSDLGLNPSTAGTVIRIILPAMTEETRFAYVKQVKQEGENARVALRNLRTDVNKKIKASGKELSWSEDDQRHYTDLVQKLTDEYVDKVEVLIKAKEKELLSI